MPSSNDFNASCYLARYPDLSINGWMYKSADGSWKYGNPSHRETKNLSESANAFWHWQNFGMIEGRVCGCDLPGTFYDPSFNSVAYLARYPDVRGTSTMSVNYLNNPEWHYRNIGILQSRIPGYEFIGANSPIGMVSPGTTKPNPVAQDSYDPVTGYKINPITGYDINPKSGYDINPHTGYDINPKSGYDINPNTGLDIDPKTHLDIPIDANIQVPSISPPVISTGSFSEWISANPAMAAAVAAGIILIFMMKKKTYAKR